MPFTCSICNFSAPSNYRYQKHLATQKHARNYNKCLLVPTNEEPNVQETVNSVTEEPNVEISYEEIQDDPSFKYHIVSNGDFQSINPIFLDIDTFNFFQSIKKTIDTNPYVIYVISFFFSLYTTFHEFVNPALDSSVEYIDCTPSQDSFPNTSVQD